MQYFRLPSNFTVFGAFEKNMKSLSANLRRKRFNSFQANIYFHQFGGIASLRDNCLRLVTESGG